MLCGGIAYALRLPYPLTIKTSKIDKESSTQLIVKFASGIGTKLGNVETLLGYANLGKIPGIA
jgi:hypothetical protein